MKLSKIKAKIYTKIRSVLIKIIPEIEAINKNYLTRTKKGEMVKLYSPYRLKDCSVGTGTYIAENSVISRTKIGKFCSIGPNLVCGWGLHPSNGISTHPYFYSTLKQNGFTIANKNFYEESQPIVIGNDVFIGANVTILDGIKIGNGAIIGAGAVVSKDIPDYAIAIGVPIQILKYRFPKEIQKKLNKTAWWDLNEKELHKVNKYFFDINGFIDNLKIDDKVHKI